ncbi:MAG TPA: DUF2281 domain-containing protein [Chitinophagales bacterium]|nr:DUF2281 domain-containing protein [Chitinophagales bacterium]
MSHSFIEKIKKLPPEKLQSAEDYVDFLLSKNKKNGMKANGNKKKRGGLGIWKGKGKMAKDFDAPLEMFKEYQP